MLLIERLQRYGVIRIPQSDVVEGGARLRHFRLRNGARRAEVLDLHVVEVERGAGGLDVPLYVGRFERGLGRGDLERLEERRVDHTDHESHEGPYAYGEDGQRPTLAPDVEEQDGGGEDRDDDEQFLRRQAGVHVGVAGAVDVAVMRVHQAPPLQDVPGRLGQRDER